VSASTTGPVLTGPVTQRDLNDVARRVLGTLQPLSLPPRKRGCTTPRRWPTKSMAETVKNTRGGTSTLRKENQES
jgi:hypothetical protein